MKELCKNIQILAFFFSIGDTKWLNGSNIFWFLIFYIFGISKYFVTYFWHVFIALRESTVMHTNRELKGNRLTGTQKRFHYTFDRDPRNSASVRKQAWKGNYLERFGSGFQIKMKKLQVFAILTKKPYIYICKNIS